MAVSISTKGKTAHNDLNEANLDGLAYLKSIPNKQRSAFISAIDACITALDVDGNNLHNTSLTIAASCTSSSISISIS